MKPFLLTAALLASSLSQAALVTVSHTPVSAAYLQQGGSAYSGEFDLAGSLPADAGLSPVIDWAEATFYFRDDGDARFSGRYGTYESGYRTYYYDDPETAHLTMSGDSVLASSGYDSVVQTSARQVVRSVPYSYRCGLFRSCTGYRSYSYPVTDYQYRNGYTGDFSVSVLLGGTALQQLLDEGLAAFSVGAVQGDLLLTGARLVASVSGAAAVPEPGALVLLGTGMFCMVLLRRRGLTLAKRRMALAAAAAVR